MPTTTLIKKYGSEGEAKRASEHLAKTCPEHFSRATARNNSLTVVVNSEGLVGLSKTQEQQVVDAAVENVEFFLKEFRAIEGRN